MTEAQRQKRRDLYNDWARRNPEKIRAKAKRNYERRKEEITRYNHAWYQKNKEQAKADAMALYWKDPLKRSRSNRLWRALNTQNKKFKDTKNLKTRVSYAVNPAIKLAKNKEWRKANPGKWAALSAKRRALKKRASMNTVGISAWMNRCRLSFEVRCYYCDRMIPSWSVHFDHVVALSRGGMHAIGNLCTSCARCNLSKQDKMIDEWAKEGQQVLSL